MGVFQPPSSIVSLLEPRHQPSSQYKAASLWFQETYTQGYHSSCLAWYYSLRWTQSRWSLCSLDHRWGYFLASSPCGRPRFHGSKRCLRALVWKSWCIWVKLGLFPFLSLHKGSACLRSQEPDIVFCVTLRLRPIWRLGRERDSWDAWSIFWCRQADSNPELLSFNRLWLHSSDGLPCQLPEIPQKRLLYQCAT